MKRLWKLTVFLVRAKEETKQNHLTLSLDGYGFDLRYFRNLLDCRMVQVEKHNQASLR